MRLAIIAAVIAILIGFGAGYLMWGERARQAIEERQRVTTELDATKERQADELRKLREELAAERDRRQRLEEVISQGRK
jgi:Skp family chaperone for outer membrane proteins